MPLKDAVKISRKTFFNPSGWIGYESLKSQFKMTGDILRTIFSPPTAQRQETFEQAKERLKLSEDDIKNTGTRYLSFAVIFVLLGLATVAFSFYLLFHHTTFAGCLLGLVCGALFFAYAFRYHFWYFQIKHRKLGCTIEEWRSGKISDRKEQKL